MVQVSAQFDSGSGGSARIQSVQATAVDFPTDLQSQGFTPGSGASASATDVAQQILDAGGSDERVDAFVQAVSSLSVDEAAEVVQAVLEQDANAGMWLNAESLLERADQGQISRSEAGTAAAALAQAYNLGLVSFEQAAQLSGFNSVIQSQAHPAAFLSDGPENPGRDYLDFVALGDEAGLSYSSRQALDRFQLGFGAAVLGDSIPDRRGSFPNPDGSWPTRGPWQKEVAVVLMGAEGAGPRAVANLLGQLTQEQRQEVYSQAAEIGWFANQLNALPAEDRAAQYAMWAMGSGDYVSVDYDASYTFSDPFALITGAIAAGATGHITWPNGPRFGEMAVELMGWAARDGRGNFVNRDQTGILERTSLLSDVLLAHGEYALDTLTAGGVLEISLPGETGSQMGRNLNTLAFALRMTALDPGLDPASADVQAVQTLFRDYVVKQLEAANIPPGELSDASRTQAQDTAYWRLARLGAVYLGAVDQVQQTFQGRAEESAAFMNNAINFALSVSVVGGFMRMGRDAMAETLMAVVPRSASAATQDSFRNFFTGMSGSAQFPVWTALNQTQWVEFTGLAGQDAALVAALFENASGLVYDSVINASNTPNQAAHDIESLRDEMTASR